jgi:NADPH:quinone reductase-like Zn-dependent oxidoreductase
MPTLTVCAATDLDPCHVGYVGYDVNKAPWAWVTSQPAYAAESVEVPDRWLLPCPEELPPELLLTAINYWPAWRAMHWARLEFGNGLLIVGSGRLAETVAKLSRCWGILWRVKWSTSAGTDGERWLPLLPGQGANELLQVLPARPDSAVVLEGGAEVLRVTLEVCRDEAAIALVARESSNVDLNLYPELHRRGLRIRVGCPFKYTPRDVEGWRRAAGLIGKLVTLGRLDRQVA